MTDHAWAPHLESTAEIVVGTTRSGLVQLRRSWRPDTPPRGAVLIVHGIAEHSGRYEHVARQLGDAGFLVVSYDQRAHGKSEGRAVSSFDELHDDLEDHLAEIRKLDVPAVVLGHSMGGLVSAGYGLTDRPQPDLFVLSAPALSMSLPRWSWKAVSTLGRALGPTRMSIPIEPDQLSSDLRVGQVYSKDPDVRLDQSVALIGAMVRAVEDYQADEARWGHRALIVHGLDDRIVPPEVSEPLGRSHSVDRRTYEGLRHEVFNEPSGPAVVSDVVAWIDGQLAPGRRQP